MVNGNEEKVELEDLKVTYITQFLGELLNMAILDSGCTQSVCGKTWLEVYSQTLPKAVDESLVITSSKRVFRLEMERW